MLRKGHRIYFFDFGGKSPEIRTNHLFVLPSRAMNGMTGGGILNARPNKRASIVAFRCKSVMQSMEEAQYPVFRAVRLGLDGARKPLPKHSVLALESRNDQVFFGTEVLVERHASDAGLLKNRIDTHRVKADFTEHSLCDGEKMVTLSNGHCPKYTIWSTALCSWFSNMLLIAIFSR